MQYQWTGQVYELDDSKNEYFTPPLVLSRLTTKLQRYDNSSSLISFKEKQAIYKAKHTLIQSIAKYLSRQNLYPTPIVTSHACTVKSRCSDIHKDTCLAGDCLMTFEYNAVNSLVIICFITFNNINRVVQPTKQLVSLSH